MTVQPGKHLETLIEREKLRLSKIKNQTVAPQKGEETVIGILPGDGIGPIIMEQALRVLKKLLAEQIKNNAVSIKIIEGLTLENRVKTLQSVPDHVLAEAKTCNVILKGPTTTPKATDNLPNLPSANAALRRELDLFAAVRKINIPERNIDWTFFRENIEGAYLFGSDGIMIDDEIAIDFVVATKTGGLRIAKQAFEYARRNHKPYVTAISKANIIKMTDGAFLKYCREVAQAYPEIHYDERMVDVTAAKLNDPSFHQNLSVFILPNLYGDIITDIAAEIQGEVGASGSANIGDTISVFETTHGTAPFLIENKLEAYASPKSLLKALVMLLDHCQFTVEANSLEIAMQNVAHIIVNGNATHATAAYYVDKLLENIEMREN